jgi:hypothetical protein
MRVYLTEESQAVLDNATNVRPGTAQLIWVYVDVDNVPFNKGFYTVDAIYFYRVTAEAYTGIGKPTTIEGVASYSKRVILYGGEGAMRTFNSTYKPTDADVSDLDDFKLPLGVVETVEPILLSVKVLDIVYVPGGGAIELLDIPPEVLSAFDSPIATKPGTRVLFVTIGQFSVVKLEREVQLLMPVYDNCVPDKECNDITSEDPCEVFEHVRFPVEDFTAPQSAYPAAAGTGASCNC